MAKKINVYDINNSAYLYEDIENIIERIGQLYEVEFFSDRIDFISKITFPEGKSWISDDVTSKFNETIPVIKSIIKDIYAALEGVYVAKRGKFEKITLEKKYKHLTELREFNNKLKHHNTKNVIFQIVSMVNINSGTLDCLIQYKYPTDQSIRLLQLTDFFSLFFTMLEEEEIISLHRK